MLIPLIPQHDTFLSATQTSEIGLNPVIRYILWPAARKGACLKPARIGSKMRRRMLPSAALQLFDANARGDGKRIVARRGCAMMFTALWLTGAHPELFPVMIWLAFA